MTTTEKRKSTDTGIIYRWIITSLIGITCFSLGYTSNLTQVRDTVVRNTVRIDKIEQSILDINTKLDILLARTQ